MYGNVKAYHGSGDFIFISYSHIDTERVFPVIEKMCQEGYNVWFDEGIDPGTEWDENIATHIKNCGYFIAFMSQNYMGSSNCKDELKYARDNEKKILLVYLEEVKLSAGMEMRLNRLQYICKYTYSFEEEFYAKLYTADDINNFKGENQGYYFIRGSGRKERVHDKTPAAPVECKLVVYRRSRWGCSIRNFKIHIDGKQIGVITNGGRFEYSLPEGEYELMFTIDWLSERVKIKLDRNHPRTVVEIDLVSSLLTNSLKATVLE